MPDPFRLSALGQISMGARDIERATAFYRDVLGLPHLFSAPPGLAFFDLDGVRLMLSAPEGAEEDRAGSVLYFAVGDIRAAHARLVERGVRFEGEPHVVARLRDRLLWMAFFRDSEENLLALMSEVPAEAPADGDPQPPSGSSRP